MLGDTPGVYHIHKKTSRFPMTAPIPIARERIATLKKRATLLSVLVGFAMLCVKAAAFFATGSISVLTSVLDSLMDNAMGVVNFIAVRKSLKPADRRHRFGFGKFEPLAGLVQGAFIVVVAVLIAVEAVQRLIEPQTIENAELGVGAMLVATALMGGLVLYQNRVVRLTGSIVVRADALHYKADVLMHVGIIASLSLGDALGAWWLDAACALAIALFLAWGARGIFKQSLAILLDREIPDADRKRIRAVALAHPKVQDIHDLRTRSSGDRAFAQLHLEMNGAMTLDEAHRVAHEVIDALERELPDTEVQIHQEPAGDPRDRTWRRMAGLAPCRRGECAAP